MRAPPPSDGVHPGTCAMLPVCTPGNIMHYAERTALENGTGTKEFRRLSRQGYGLSAAKTWFKARFVVVRHGWWVPLSDIEVSGAGPAHDVLLIEPFEWPTIESMRLNGSGESEFSKRRATVGTCHRPRLSLLVLLVESYRQPWLVRTVGSPAAIGTTNRLAVRFIYTAYRRRPYLRRENTDECLLGFHTRANARCWRVGDLLEQNPGDLRRA